MVRSRLSLRSLFTAIKFSKKKAGKKLGKGLFIDADSRIIDSIDKTIEINSLETYFKFKSGG